MRVPIRTKPSGKWRLYIVQCRDGSLYTGITNDLERRLEQHNSGRASRYTRARLPVELLHAEACRNKSSALKMELRIKALTRQEKEEYIARKSRKKPRRGQRPGAVSGREKR